MKTSGQVGLSPRLVLINHRQCVCCEVCTEVEDTNEHRASNTIDCECVTRTRKWNVKRSCLPQAYLKNHHRAIWKRNS